MSDTNELYQPVVRGAASICHFDLSFRFLTREQCQNFINLYLDEFEYADNIRYQMVPGDSITKNEHWIYIEDGVWATNLKRIAELLVECDYEEEKFDE